MTRPPQFALTGLLCDRNMTHGAELSHLLCGVAQGQPINKSLQGADMLRRVVGRMKRSLDPAPQDIANIIRYGRKGPIAHERIWIDPRKITRVVAPHPAELGMGPDHPEFRRLRRQRARARALVGKVIGEELDDFQFRPLSLVGKIKACRKRWQEGLSWEEAGAISGLMLKIDATGSSQSGCHTREDVVRRYQRLDEVFERVKAEGRLESYVCRKRGFHREPDGVEIHLGRMGEPLFGATGTHRLAMALVLGLDRIPASLGFVHESALDILPFLRRGTVRHPAPMPRDALTREELQRL